MLGFGGVRHHGRLPAHGEGCVLELQIEFLGSVKRGLPYCQGGWQVVWASCACFSMTKVSIVGGAMRQELDLSGANVSGKV